LYSLALKASILEKEKNWDFDDSVAGERERTDFRHMIVERDPVITDGLPTEFESHFIEYSL